MPDCVAAVVAGGREIANPPTAMVAGAPAAFRQPVVEPAVGNEWQELQSEPPIDGGGKPATGSAANGLPASWHWAQLPVIPAWWNCTLAPAGWQERQALLS